LTLFNSRVRGEGCRQTELQRLMAQHADKQVVYIGADVHITDLDGELKVCPALESQPRWMRPGCRAACLLQPSLGALKQSEQQCP
jgi:hypothetical protein